MKIINKIKNNISIMKWITIFCYILINTLFFYIYQKFLYSLFIILITSSLIIFTLIKDKKKNIEINKFFNQILTEIKNIHWSSPKETFKMTIIVLITSIIVSIILWILDRIIFSVISSIIIFRF